MRWIILITSLPSQSATPRMRIWRALKTSGAGVLRDGVYVLPDRDGHESVLQQQAQRVQDAGGTAYLLKDQNLDQVQLKQLFDRTGEYDAWSQRLVGLKEDLRSMDEPQARRLEAQLRRELENIGKIDFFPESGDESAQYWNRHTAKQALRDISRAINDRFSPGEPTATNSDIRTYAAENFTGCVWATRKNLWIDRVASAWLIKRFIDPRATFFWFDQHQEIPDGAVGFDYDDAVFTHINELVTFEVLLHSFNLVQDPSLVKIGAVVHYLDVGGLPVPEAPGLITLLAGARSSHKKDDEFLETASVLMDNLYAGYDKEN